MHHELIIAFFLLILAQPAAGVETIDPKGDLALSETLLAIAEIVKHQDEDRLDEVFKWYSQINYRGTIYKGLAQIHAWYRKLIYEDRITDVVFSDVRLVTRLSEVDANGSVKMVANPEENTLHLEFSIKLVLNEDYIYVVENLGLTNLP
ncbi:unnamed protein product [Caenorhabditis auriculariae]|uniref:Nuclear transport factor 2 family protein n=1 Tax=Caenorhabditis auriculariae TaxID=2777116 RepID=A0A8S1H4M2_9PELO|nr:unnamed protein product [Caenorhabditis auriculariae]